MNLRVNLIFREYAPNYPICMLNRLGLSIQIRGGAVYGETS
jgi:hypothetical protein